MATRLDQHFIPEITQPCRELVDLRLQKRLAREKLQLELTDKAWKLLGEMGYDPQFGARPLKRVIQQELTNELSKNILGGNYTFEDTILVDAKKDEFVFSKKVVSK